MFTDAAITALLLLPHTQANDPSVATNASSYLSHLQ